VRWRGAIVLAIAVVLAAGLGQTGVGHTILRKAGLFEEPASYTSLAFLQPQSLPELLSSKRANVAVSFVVHNAGSTPREYQWSVLLGQNQRMQRIASGSVRVASGRDGAITQSAEIICKRGRVKIVVNLTRPSESIDAWTDCRQRRS
jgi:hypothetical protein